ncbi:hypothetical protein J8281_15880 [Aquimarina sp. U1-2]|uniref:hypothetical protein n=1 Tax=Aquimarina sp. U1-2 TaxID=2823141 RepID=UPI001AEC8A90|nr:hypothetical protein [Aquimarina sp. U1-2]MBP2833676.1 hypothetical protein [Aquimarina sp. U1-2]
MKFLKYIFITILMVLVGCERNEIDFQSDGPSITTEGNIPELTKKAAGNEIFQSFTFQSTDGIDKFEVFQDNDLIDSVIFNSTLSANYEFAFTIPEETPDFTRITFTFLVTDALGEQAKKEFKLLVAPTFFEFEETVNSVNVTRIKGELNKDYTLEKDRIYIVDSVLSVNSGNNLIIEAGNTVYFKTFDNPALTSRLVIAQGAKIIAEGTANDPIILTSDKLLKGETPNPYDWGGVTIYGKAPTNEGDFVIDDGFRYGGNVVNDNSGILTFIRSEYAGNLLENGLHAFQFNGVGLGTTVNHIQVYRNYNIAFRLRGGRVSLKYISAIGHGGYGLWAGRGWQGNGQFWLFQTDVKATLVPVNYWNIARSIEFRSDGDNFLNEPRTRFNVSNVTIIGNGFEANVNNGTRRGVRVRQGSIGTFQNAVVTGFPGEGSRIDDLDLDVLGSEMIFDNIRSYGSATNFVQEAETVFFNDPENVFNVTDEPIPGITLANFVGSIPSAFNPTSLGSFFSSAPYIGAIENEANDWTTQGDTWFKNLDGTFR